METAERWNKNEKIIRKIGSFRRGSRVLCRGNNCRRLVHHIPTVYTYIYIYIIYTNRHHHTRTHAQVVFPSYIWATRGLHIFTSRRRHRRRRLPRQDGSAQIWLLYSAAKYPLARPAGSSHRRDNNVGCRRVKGGVAKCLTRCSKLHLIQRPRLAKWHIVRGASINEAPLPCGGGGVPLPEDKSLYIHIHTVTAKTRVHSGRY